MVRTATRVAVAAACAAGVAGFVPTGPVGNLRLRGVNAEARLNVGGPRLRAAPSKISMMAAAPPGKVDARRFVLGEESKRLCHVELDVLLALPLQNDFPVEPTHDSVSHVLACRRSSVR